MTHPMLSEIRALLTKRMQAAADEAIAMNPHNTQAANAYFENRLANARVEISLPALTALLDMVSPPPPPYYAQGRVVRKRPDRRPGVGLAGLCTVISIGHQVCVVDELVGEEGAKFLADMLNKIDAQGDGQ